MKTPMFHKRAERQAEELTQPQLKEKAAKTLCDYTVVLKAGEVFLKTPDDN